MALAPDRGCPSRNVFEDESPKRNETRNLGEMLRLRQPRSVRAAIGGSAKSARRLKT